MRFDRPARHLLLDDPRPENAAKSLAPTTTGLIDFMHQEHGKFVRSWVAPSIALRR